MTSTTIISPNSPTPTPTPYLISNVYYIPSRKWILTFPTINSITTLFHIVTLTLILSFLFLSLISLSYIITIRLKSHFSPKLHKFSAPWSPRFLMVISITFWAFNEFSRLPIFEDRFHFPNFVNIPIRKQIELCKIHMILSFGLYEPGFLICLLFLVIISIRKHRPSSLWLIGLLIVTCLPLIIALYFVVYVLPGKFLSIPLVFYRTSVLLQDKNTGMSVVFCTYPLLGNLIFVAFGVTYAIMLCIWCFKVISIAINQRMRWRINTLVHTVIVCLSAQMVMVMVSILWNPESWTYYFVDLVCLLCVLICASVGQGILVIIPISDALNAGGNEDVTPLPDALV